MGWANYVALGDSLTAGRDDHGPGGAWAMPGAAGPHLFGPDRIHPNGSGHQLMADAFAALLLPG